MSRERKTDANGRVWEFVEVGDRGEVWAEVTPPDGGAKPVREQHGHWKSPVYRAWQQMKTRCENPAYRQYAQYGGRGITYSQSWAKFSGFLADMGHSYIEGLSLDRINNDGPYSAANCRWADRLTQANNTSQNVTIETPDGEMTIAVAARFYGLTYDCLFNRIRRGKSPAAWFKKMSRRAKEVL